MSFVPLAAEEWSWMVRDATAAMIGTCDIVSVGEGTTNPDGSGENGPTITTTVPCRFLDAGGGAEVLAAMRLTVTADGIISVPLGTIATEEETVTYAGETWLIVGTNLGDSYATSLALAVKVEE